MLHDQGVSPSRIGRLFWIIGGSILLLILLGWYFLASKKNTDAIGGGTESAVQEPTTMKADEDHVMTPEQKRAQLEQEDKELRRINMAQANNLDENSTDKCALERCDTNTAGKIAAIDGATITISPSILGGDIAADVADITLQLDPEQRIRHYDYTKGAYTNTEGLSVGDNVKLTLGGQRQILYIVVISKSTNL